MTHYDIDYSNLSREAADEKALRDIWEYVTPKQRKAMLAYAEQVRLGKADIQQLDATLQMIVGISGYPLEAFYRAHCLDAFKAWFAEAPAVALDDAGFRIK